MKESLKKVRIDELLVLKNLSENISDAKIKIMAGKVIVNDHLVHKASEKFFITDDIKIKLPKHNFVSRGGLKLEHALAQWPLNLKNFVALDVGASTGGFTEVLLTHGALKVYSVDVGYAQLAQKLRADSRVVNLERTHILSLSAEQILEKVDVIVIDVSFISLEKVLPKACEFLKDKGQIYLLVKPQFEAKREDVPKGGVITDEKIRLAALEKIVALGLSLGLSLVGVDKSPILGAKGNQEYLVNFLK